MSDIVDDHIGWIAEDEAIRIERENDCDNLYNDDDPHTEMVYDPYFKSYIPMRRKTDKEPPF